MRACDTTASPSGGHDDDAIVWHQRSNAQYLAKKPSSTTPCTFKFLLLLVQDLFAPAVVDYLFIQFLSSIYMYMEVIKRINRFK